MEKHPEKVFLEKARIEKLSLIREIVFGAQDGLLVPLGVVSSVAGAFLNNHIVIIAGISEALAGAFSMATGAYLASQAEKQVHESEILREESEVAKNPVKERDEMIALFEKEGLSSLDGKKLVEILSNSKQAFLNTMIQKELGLEPNPPGTPVNDALYVGLSYLVAAIIPISPYFFIEAARAVVISILLTLAALFGLGLLKARYAKLPPIKSGLQVLLIGALSGVGGYILGFYLPHILGLR